MSGTNTDARPSRAPDAEMYPIRTVSTLTGVNAITLRAWERRYGLIKPRRTAKGHRLYNRRDIELINRIVALLDKGLSISQVARAVREETAPETPGPAQELDIWARYRESMIDAITRFDENALEESYNDALSLYPIDVVTTRLLVPLLKELGKRWESAEGSVAEEHFFGVYMRNKLGARFHHRNRHNSGPRLLLACLEGEFHEIGVLLLALATHDRGYRIVLLGANMPLADLPLVVRRARCDAIILSSSMPPKETVISDELRALVEATDVPVFVGGLTSVRRRDAISRAGALPVGDDLQHGLRLIGAELQPPG